MGGDGEKSKIFTISQLAHVAAERMIRVSLITSPEFQYFIRTRAKTARKHVCYCAFSESIWNIADDWTYPRGGKRETIGGLYLMWGGGKKAKRFGICHT